MKKILFMLILLIPFFVYAECDSKVTISKLELKEKKGYAEELEPSSYECNNIKLNIKMYNKDDSVIYNLTIKNNSDDDVELSNNFSSGSEYIVYKIEDDNLVVEKGKEKTFKLSATYTKQVDVTLLSNGTLEDNHVMNLSVTTKDENPNTSSTSIIIIAIVLLVSIITIILLIINKKHAPKYMALLLIPVLVIPIVVYALTKFELKLEAKVVLAKPIQPICKKATVLHTKTCEKTSNGCAFDVETGSTITYGSIPNGFPKAGDAYDCDVNNDGVYDSETERFYYIKSEGENSVLVYYSNYNVDEKYNFRTGQSSYVDEYLPSTTEWSNPGLINPGVRNAMNDYGSVRGWTTIDNTITLNYTNKAARLLTLFDVETTCREVLGFSSSNTRITGCNWLFENLKSYDGTGAMNYWLETVIFEEKKAYGVEFPLKTINAVSYIDHKEGVRPAITVKTTNIEKDSSEKEVISYPNGKTKETVETGDVVLIGEEEFIVLRHDGKDLVLLSKYNLKVGKVDNYDNTEIMYTSDDEGYGRQSVEVRSIVFHASIISGMTSFADTNYWDDGQGHLKSEYDGHYYPGKDYPYVYNNNSSLYQYVENYKTYLESLGVTVKEARLLNVHEIPSNEKFTLGLSLTKFWLGNAYDSNSILDYQYSGGNESIFPTSGPSGVRPIIVI